MEDGVYIVRVGDEAGNVSETYFRVGEEQSAGPKVTFMNGTTTVATVDTVGGKATLPETNPTLAPVEGYATTAYTFVEWVTVTTIDGAEVVTPFTADTVVEADTTVYPKFKSNFTTGDIDGKNGVKAADKGKIHYYLKSRNVTNADVVGIPVSHLLGDDVLTGDIDGKNGVKAADKGKIHYYLKSRGVTNADVVNLDIYVVNK